MGNDFRKFIFRFVVCLVIVVMILPLTAPHKSMLTARLVPKRSTEVESVLG